MSLYKRAVALCLAVGIAAAGAGCGKNTTTALTVDGYEVPAGVYIYFLNTAYNNGISELAKEQPDLDTEDTKAVKASTVEGTDFTEWVKNKATELAVDFVATEKKFDELGLELSAETKLNLDSMVDYYWATYEETMTANGVSEESFTKIMTSSYKSEEVFNYYYGVDGQEGVTEDDLENYYAENNIRCQYVKIDLHDSEGNLLKSDGKAEMLELAEGYQERVEDALKDGGVEAVMTEMNYVKEGYDYYVTSVSEEAAGITGEEAATQAPRETEAEPEDEETVTTVEADAEDAENDEDTETEAEDADAEDTEEETNAEEDEAASETVAADIDEETDETETTGASYENESIITVIDLEDYDDPSDVYYNPSEPVYNKLLEIGEADYGKPFLVQEDEAYYLVVRYDIRERMTEDDLWTENAVYNAQLQLHSDDFETMMDGWTDAMSVTRNEAAYRRYDPFKLDFAF
ncbi:MAG: hypothetical protein IJ055_05770 [Oscillospiraceae bacterium]|nr:hypothetical protein [Oscillospiraceae bacterium]